MYIYNSIVVHFWYKIQIYVKSNKLVLYIYFQGILYRIYFYFDFFCTIAYIFNQVSMYIRALVVYRVFHYDQYLKKKPLFVVKSKWKCCLYLWESTYRNELGPSLWKFAAVQVSIYVADHMLQIGYSKCIPMPIFGKFSKSFRNFQISIDCSAFSSSRIYFKWYTAYIRYVECMHFFMWSIYAYSFCCITWCEH